MGSYGEVIVCDWGLSKVYDQQSETNDINQQLLNPEILNTNTIDGFIKGSPGYMAPEQISGEKKTPQTDIFSLGCLLYSLVCHEAPFRNKDLNKILESTLKADYTIKADIPGSIQAVISKSMSVKSEDRYESVKTLKEEIENFLNGYATEAEQASSIKLLKLFILRNKALSTLTLLSLVTIITGTLTFILEIKKEKDKAEENLLLFQNQKQETSKAQKEYYRSLIKNENNSFHENFDENTIQLHNKTIKGLETLIEAYPEYTEARSSLGYHLFINQEFKKSYTLLKQDPGIYSYMLPHLIKYKDLKEDSELLESKLFLALLKDIEPVKPLHMKLLNMYSQREKNVEKVIPAIKQLLERMNPGWNSENFKYLPENHRLVINGENFKSLSLSNEKNTPINAIRIKSLVLRDTSIENIKPLSSLPLRILDVSNSKVPFFNLQKHLPESLFRIIVAKDQYNEKHLSQLKDLIEIKFMD